MKKGIYLSIKKEFTRKIENGEKNYEFRKYIPKQGVELVFVYEPSPTCALKYILEICDIVVYPDKILKQGYGNDDFNNGLKKSKYAYEISNVYKLSDPLSLEILKNKYGFSAPQSYAYDSRYPELSEYLNSCEKDKIR